MQTCVHMYFRTASDLAPEITRFNAFGLVDDLGSMHHILRPETIESLLMLWRTTKAQIYRNWGQRLLSAFSRRKTDFGYASLHNVNQPEHGRDDMPSFFLAETVKYLYLLFSPDSVLSLHDNVLSTEAHPMPVPDKAKNARWRCGTGRSLREKRQNVWEPAVTTDTAVSTAKPPVEGVEPTHEAEVNVASESGWASTQDGLLHSMAGPWDFNGASFMDLPDSPASSPDSTFSVELYAKCGSIIAASSEANHSEASGCGSGYRSPLTSRDIPQSGYMFYVGPDDRWTFWVGSGQVASGHQLQQLPGPVVKAGMWTHLLGVVNTTTQEARFYVDSELVGSRQGVSFVPNRQQPLRLGAGASERRNPDFYFTGEVRDVAIWSLDVKAGLAPPATSAQLKCPLVEIRQARWSRT